MKAIEAFAELIGADDAPHVAAVTLQHFRLDKAAWVNLASVTADSAGKARLRVPMLTDDKASAPTLRLIHADTDPPQVLSEGGRTVYTPSTGVLSIEFGRIRLIDPAEAAPLVPRFRAAPQSLAGVAAASTAAPDMQFDDTVAIGRQPFRFPTVNLGTATTRIETDKLISERNAALLAATQRETDVRNLTLNLAAEKQRAETAEKLAAAAASPNNPAFQAVQLRLTELTKANTDFSAKVQDRDRALAVANAEREQLRAEADRKAALVAAFEAEKKSVVPIAFLASNVQAQIAKAQIATADSPNLMRLGTVHIKVRGKLGDGGSGITLPGNDAIQENAGGTLDEVSFDIDTGGDKEIPKIPAPDVTRLTETAARQVLASLGFRADVIIGAAAPGFAPGQAMRQAPVAGTLTSRGATILVVFAA